LERVMMDQGSLAVNSTGDNFRNSRVGGERFQCQKPPIIKEKK